MNMNVKKNRTILLQIIMAITFCTIITTILVSAIITNQSILKIQEMSVAQFKSTSSHILTMYFNGDDMLYHDGYGELGVELMQLSRKGLEGEKEVLFQNIVLDKDIIYENYELVEVYGISIYKDNKDMVHGVYRKHIGDYTYTVDGIILNYSHDTFDMYLNLFMLIIISFVFVLFVAFNVSDRITKPLERLTGNITTIADGDFDVKISEDLYKYTNEIGILAVSIETMRKRLQDFFNEIKDANQTLENKVQLRTSELEAVNEELKIYIKELKETQGKLVESQKQLAITNLVRGVAHKLNTPIGVAYTTVTYLSKVLEKSKDMPSSVKESISILQSSIEESINIVKMFKQISTDESESRLEYIDMGEHVMECVEIIKMDKANSHIDFHCEIEEGVLYNTYPAIVFQVINRIVSNSRDHAFNMMEYGIVNIKFFKTEHFIELIISDNGKGISDEALLHIFEPFYSTRFGTLNTGLGLSIVYNLVKNKLHGNIECRQLLNGVEFRIQLPYDEVMML